MDSAGRLIGCATRDGQDEAARNSLQKQCIVMQHVCPLQPPLCHPALPCPSLAERHASPLRLQCIVQSVVNGVVLHSRSESRETCRYDTRTHKAAKQHSSTRTIGLSVL